MDAKGDLRTEMRRLLRRVPRELVADASAAVVVAVRALPQWQERRRNLLYAPLPDEIDPSQLFARDAGRKLFAPRIVSLDPPTMEAAQVRRPPPALDYDDEKRMREDESRGEWVEPIRDWTRGRFGNWEPWCADAFPPDRLTFALVPGLAFTRDGRRLGRGKGFYDRFLSTLGPRCFTCGVGFDFQLVDDLPTDPHDVTLDAVVTPGGVWG